MPVVRAIGLDHVVLRCANIEQSLKWDPEALVPTVRKYQDLSREPPELRPPVPSPTSLELRLWRAVFDESQDGPSYESAISQDRLQKANGGRLSCSRLPGTARIWPSPQGVDNTRAK